MHSLNVRARRFNTVEPTVHAKGMVRLACTVTAFALLVN